MNRAHLIRLHPTKEQEVYFRKACGVARHAYNWALAQWKEARAKGKRVKMNDLKREYNRIKGEQFPWVYEVTKCAPEQAFADLGQAFANYWRMEKEGTQPKLKHSRKDGEEAGFPRFKSKKHDQLSFYLANDKFSVEGHSLTVPKLGKVNMTEELRFQGKILSAVISEQAGWWFVSISVEMEHELARAHYKVACQRQETLHKMTTYLARTYALIGMEDLNAKGMLANHCLAQAVSDASFFEVKRQLLYKAEQYGGYVQLVDRWYASSKICHHCGWVKQDLTLADRVWVCEQCGAINERDLNASLNVRDEAIRLVTDVPVVASSGHKFACGVDRSGPVATSGETVCAEAGTQVT